MNRLPDHDQRDQDGEWQDALDEPMRFHCACGDAGCLGWDDDPKNIKLGTAWYAADCVTATNHPEVIRLRELDALYDRSRR